MRNYSINQKVKEKKPVSLRSSEQEFSPSPINASDKLLHRLLALHPKRIDLVLDRILLLLSKLGNPHLNCPPIVHIAGTNGKGSTVAFLKAMAQAAGKKVHTYTSPHLIRFHERIGLYGEPIDETQLADILTLVEQANAGEPITFFEITTAAAFVAFAENPADLLILETGLGGRFDATNVFDKPCAVGLTSIHLDHQDFLGQTISEIASAKAGIIKANVPAFTQIQLPEAQQVLEDECNMVGALLHQAELAPKHWNFGLEGEHQRANAGLAMALAKQIAINTSAQKQGAEKAAWAGRLQRLNNPQWQEKVPKGVELYLDGAHNRAAAEQLSAWLCRKLEQLNGSANIVLGLMNNRSIHEFLTPFLPLKNRLHLHALAIPGEDNAHCPQSIVETAQKMGFEIKAAADLDLVFESIKVQSPVPRLVLVAGSLYLIGALLRGKTPSVNEYSKISR